MSGLLQDDCGNRAVVAAGADLAMQLAVRSCFCHRATLGAPAILACVPCVGGRSTAPQIMAMRLTLDRWLAIGDGRTRAHHRVPVLDEVLDSTGTLQLALLYFKVVPSM